MAVPRKWLEQTRTAWEQEANKALRRAGRGEHCEEKTQISGVLERADRVEKDNEALVEERDSGSRR